MRRSAYSVGVPAQTIETASKPELWLLVHYYETMSQGGKIPSLFDEFAAKKHIEKSEAAVERWAKAQPDFIEENYMVTNYQEPFNPATKQLRILVINDEVKLIDSLLVEVSTMNPMITITYVNDVAAAFRLLRRDPPNYDVVLTDYVTRAGNAQELGMWAHKNRVKIPIVFFSNGGGTPSWLYSYNMVGSISPSSSAKQVVNYLSNMLATGRAYPNH